MLGEKKITIKIIKTKRHRRKKEITGQRLYISKKETLQNIVDNNSNILIFTFNVNGKNKQLK